MVKKEKNKAIDRAEEAYTDECNRGRYTTAMSKAIAVYEEAMLEAGHKMCPRKPTEEMSFLSGGWPEAWDAVDG